MSNYLDKKNGYLFLPVTYEEIISEVDSNEKQSRLSDVIVPLPKFEEQIIQIIADIRSNGYLVFLYGESGVGKSTFISSLQFQAHISIKEIFSINTTKLVKPGSSDLKLTNLFKEISQKATNFFEKNTQMGDKLCIVIDYLENVEGEEESKIKAFFRDLNGLLRQYGILIIWPVTVMEDLENMKKFAESFSTTMFHPRIPTIHFTGPELLQYPSIAKKTIKFFNDGKECYEFQLHDHDFQLLKTEYEKKPSSEHKIRNYLQGVKQIWGHRTDQVTKIAKSIPKPTEVWFIFPYPEAESVVARFAKQIPETIIEMWDAEYNPLQPYIQKHNKRNAEWPSRRLTLALNSRMLTTKIMYLPTNSLISCIVAYSKEAEIKISRQDFKDPDKYKVPGHWFGKTHAQNTLKRTPLFLQLSGKQITPGKRKSGKVNEALENARKAYEKLNEDTSSSKPGKLSDQRLNKAMYLALQDVLYFEEQDTFKAPKFQLSCETTHPYLPAIKPDITIETQEKLICLEFCYTTDDTPGKLAAYVLDKLNNYMTQLQHHFNINIDAL